MCPDREALGLADLDDAACSRAVRNEPRNRSFATGLGEAEDVSQDRAGALRVVEQKPDAVEAAQCMFRRDVAALPSRFLFGTGHADEGEAHAVRIGERQDRLAEALLDSFMRHALLDEAMRPVADRAFRNAEHRLLRETDAVPPTRRMCPREERQDRARMADLVTEVEVIGAGIVEVDRLLDQPEAKNARVEIEIAGRIACNRGDVMNARHGLSFLPFARDFAVLIGNVVLSIRRYNRRRTKQTVADLATI